MKILGLISGSSLDGLDMAICQFDEQATSQLEWEVIHTQTAGFPEGLLSRLVRSTELSTRELMELEVEFSKFCASESLDFLTKAKCSVDYIASHGHTVFHYPEDGYTVQIGKGSIIAELTGIPSISDFRSNDIALRGQGAPLAPIVERYLYPGYNVYFNLGGIANFSIHEKSNIRSIDSCPCNQVLNFLISANGLPYDDRGRVARSGKVNDQLLKEWSSLEYFKLSGPKSMDNSWVHQIFIPVMNKYHLSMKDALATMVEFTALQLSKDISKLLQLDSITQMSGFVTGGGAYNDYLLERMTYHFQKLGLSLEVPDAQTIEFKEAILMSLMGYLRILERPNTIPTVTGAAKMSIGGAVYLPGK